MSSQDSVKRPTVPKFASFKPDKGDSAPPEVAKKPGVPKFTSFKSRPDGSAASTPDPPPKPLAIENGHHRKERHGREHREGRERSRHTTKTHSSHHRHGRQRSRSAERRLAKSESKLIPIPTRAAETSEDSLFFTDKRGDPLIIRYGTNDRSKVPAYRRFGKGRILGAKGRFTVIYDGAREVFSLGSNFREGASAFRDRSLLSKASRTKSQIFRLRPEPETVEPNDEETADFMPLSRSRKRKRGDDEAGKASDEDGPNYRSIKGKAKARDFLDSDLESDDTASSEDDAGFESLDPVKKKSIELSRQVKDHPEDINSWLELVDLQEALLRLNEDSRFDRTNDEAKGLADMKVSLIEEALAHARDKMDRERILLRLMREGARVWTPKTLTKRWAEVKQADSSFSLWKAHLDFELMSMGTFTCDKLKQVFIDRIEFLKPRLTETLTTNVESKDDSLKDVCNELVYVFLRATRFIHDAGYTELAVAAWQSILELTFARPDQESSTMSDDLLSSFRDFWESEVPRLGEDNAKGWRYFTEAAEMADLPEAKSEPAPTLPNTRDVYKAWASVEQQKGQSGMLPARTMDEGTEDDPFRVVMFSDVEPFLFYIPSSILPSVKAAVIDAFLLFCRLPPASSSPSTWILSAYNDPFIYDGTVGFDEPDFERSHFVDETSSKKPPKFSAKGNHMATSLQVLFAGSNWFKCLGNVSSPEYELARKATKQAALTFDFELIAEYSLALAWNKDQSSAKKAAKALLKKYPSNIPLYNAYALAEWNNGHREIAQNVLLSATSQSLAGKQLLWNTWAWLELETGNAPKALARLVASAEESSPPAEPSRLSRSQILKARQQFESSRDFLLSSGNLDRSAEFAESLALLEYLTAQGDTEPTSNTQGNISAAMASVRSHGESAALERLLQFGARLLYYHASHGPFRPTFVREQLRKFVSIFPQNTIFLNLFAWAESSIRIDDPVREVLHSLALVDSQDCVSSRIFTITHEVAVGTAHSTRTAFESALNNDSCQGNVGLWRSYIQFCHSRKELKGKALDVFYRAISNCPWSKDLAMEAFVTLVKVMDSSDLQSVSSTMAAKGLRIRMDLDEFNKEWSRNSSKHS